MKLWIVKRKNLVRYDEMSAVIVRAETPKQARAIAASARHDESEECWTSAELSTCRPLLVMGKACVVMVDGRGG